MMGDVILFCMSARKISGNGSFKFSGRLRKEGRAEEFFKDFLALSLLKWCQPHSGWREHNIIVRVEGE